MNTKYQHEILTLDLPEAQREQLAHVGNGGVMFDLQATAGGKFVFSAWSAQDNAAAVGFLVEEDSPKITRQFFVCPIHHTFNAPLGLDLQPLNVLVLPDGLLAIYEVRQAGN